MSGGDRVGARKLFLFTQVPITDSLSNTVEQPSERRDYATDR